MAVIIENITEEHKITGTNKYRLRINNKIICYYEHERGHDQLAQCLRDAADAVEKATEDKKDKIMRELMEHFPYEN